MNLAEKYISSSGLNYSSGNQVYNSLIFGLWQICNTTLHTCQEPTEYISINASEESYEQVIANLNNRPPGYIERDVRTGMEVQPVCRHIQVRP
jgi:hypothetical protein